MISSRIESAWHGIDDDRLRTRLTDMLNIYSPSGKEEDVQLFLEKELHTAGLAVRRQAVEEDRYNLIVTMGSEAPPLFLVGHVDTIPLWDLEEFEARDEGDIIHGLGSADMKGGCAAMVETFLAIAEKLSPEERPEIGLLLAVGEEENGDGSTAFLEEYKPDQVIIGEPTRLAACFAHFGYLEASFVTRGRRIHSSLPELGHNAVESMLRVLLHLGRDPLFDRTTSSLVYSIRELSSSRAGFVVPDRCDAWIDLHLPPSTSPSQVEGALRELADSAGNFIDDLDLALEIDFSSPGYDLGTDSPLIPILQEVYQHLRLPLHHDAFRSHSDGNLFYKAGVKPLILGPGELEVAHTPQEHTLFSQVSAASRIYAALCLTEL